MSQSRVDIYFPGDDQAGDEVYLSDLSRLCDRVSACLRATEESITNETAKGQYRIAKLSTGSIGLALSDSNFLANGVAGAAIDLFKKTVESLQTGQSIDARIGRAALEQYRKLGDFFIRGGRATRVSGVVVTAALIANIDRLLGRETVSEGSFKGRIERLNVHNRFECALYSPLQNDGIECSFEKSLFEDVRAAVGKNVTVEGTMHFEGESAFPVRINVKRVTVHPDDESLPTLGSLRGMLTPDAFGGLSAGEFLASVRDG